VHSRRGLHVTRIKSAVIPSARLRVLRDAASSFLAPPPSLINFPRPLSSLPISRGNLERISYLCSSALCPSSVTLSHCHLDEPRHHLLHRSSPSRQDIHSGRASDARSSLIFVAGWRCMRDVRTRSPSHKPWITTFGKEACR
jgi:hypothetical protein